MGTSKRNIKPPTKKTLRVAPRKIAEEKDKDEIRLTTWNKYIEFFSLKLAGLGATTVGALEILDPNFIHATVNHPEYYLGTGLVMVGGKSMLNILIKLAKHIGSLDDKDNKNDKD